MQTALSKRDLILNILLSISLRRPKFATLAHTNRIIKHGNGLDETFLSEFIQRAKSYTFRRPESKPLPMSDPVLLAYIF